MWRPFLLVPAAGIIVAGLAIAFHATSGKSVNEVLFSGHSALRGLVTSAGTWSISALLLVLAFKGLAWGVSLGSFRGGPTFPSMFIGAAAGILASHPPGFDITGAIGVGIGAGVASMLRLPALRSGTPNAAGEQQRPRSRTADNRRRRRRVPDNDRTEQAL
jgi:hypothetical protein